MFVCSCIMLLEGCVTSKKVLLNCFRFHVLTFKQNLEKYVFILWLINCVKYHKAQNFRIYLFSNSTQSNFFRIANWNNISCKFFLISFQYILWQLYILVGTFQFLCIAGYLLQLSIYFLSITFCCSYMSFF